MFGQSVIPDDFTGEYCCYAVEWPSSPKWQAVLRGLLTLPAQGRFWDKNTGTITTAQNIVRQTLNNNLHTREVLVTCSNDVANALMAIATALGNGGSSGGGTNGCTCVSFSSRESNVQIQSTITLSDGSTWPVFASGPLPTLPESGFPQGYDDGEEYDADKCAKATKIISDLVVSLTNMAALQIGVGAIGALVILGCLVGLIVVPEATIPLLLYAMVGNVGITTALGLLANYIDENRDYFICILYTNDNIEAMIGLIAEGLDIGIALIEVEGAVAIAIKSICMWLLNGDTLGVLLTSDAKLLYPEADCTCDNCPLFFPFQGAEGILTPTIVLTDDADNGMIELEAGAYLSETRYQASAGFNASDYGEKCSQGLLTIEESNVVITAITPSVTLTTGEANSSCYTLYDDALTVIYDGEAPPTFPITCRFIDLNSNGPFNVVIEFEQATA